LFQFLCRDAQEKEESTMSPIRTRRALVLAMFAICLLGSHIVINQSLFTSGFTASAQSSSIAIYGDGYASGWSNWSWNTDVNASASAPVQSGSRSLAATYKSAYGGLYLHHNGVNLNGATTLQFYIHGGSAGGQRIKVAAADAGTKVLATVPLNSYISGGSVAANAWRQVNIPISALKLPSSTITGVVLQDEKGSPQPTFYVDAMQLVGGTTVSEPAPTAAPSSGTLSGPPPASGKRFTTRGVGSALPSGSECANLVRRTTWEPRPDNTDENRYIAQKGSDYNLEPWGGVDSRANTNILARVDGKFTGTTDEILQWGACKWGIDEDVVRAIGVRESMWHMSMLGDNGVTFGILQVKSTVWKQTSPASKKSTAFNVDYALARWRACYEGYITFLKQKYPGYGAGDMWGCNGNWFTGGWYDSYGKTYINETKAILNERKWESAEFPNHRY
jgi:hypothetical protein